MGMGFICFIIFRLFIFLFPPRTAVGSICARTMQLHAMMKMTIWSNQDCSIIHIARLRTQLSRVRNLRKQDPRRAARTLNIQLTRYHLSRLTRLGCVTVFRRLAQLMLLVPNTIWDNETRQPTTFPFRAGYNDFQV